MGREDWDLPHFGAVKVIAPVPGLCADRAEAPAWSPHGRPGGEGWAVLG